ncbi:MAG: hypothetical protein FWG30_00670 [Eubacteriaceae bacterium]|nr:hypothetical protein [Eubacteriaceae bacterium]
MKKFVKVAVLAIADVAVLYLSYSVAYFIAFRMLGLTDVMQELARFPAIFIVMAAKLIIFAAFFMYSMNVYRSLLLDVAGVAAANAVAAIISVYALNAQLSAHAVYFVIVFAIEAIVTVIARFLARGASSEDPFESAEDEDEDEEQDLSDSAFYGTVYTGVYRDSDRPAQPEQPQYSEPISQPAASEPQSAPQASAGASRMQSQPEADTAQQLPFESEQQKFASSTAASIKYAPQQFVQRKSKVSLMPGISELLPEGIQIIDDDNSATPTNYADFTQGWAEESDFSEMDLFAQDTEYDQHSTPPYGYDHIEPIAADSDIGMARRAEQMESNDKAANSLNQREDVLEENYTVHNASEIAEEPMGSSFETSTEGILPDGLGLGGTADSLSALLGALEEKESQIAKLEDQLKAPGAIEPNSFAIDLPLATLPASTKDNMLSSIQNDGLLEKILDEVRSMYSTIDSRTKALDNRSKLLEEREYKLVAKMIELDERERRLVSIANQPQQKPNSALVEMQSTIELMESLAGKKAPQPKPSVFAMPDLAGAVSSPPPAGQRREMPAAMKGETGPIRQFGDSEPYKVITPITPGEPEPAKAAPATYRTGKGVPLSVVFDYGPDDVYDDENDYDEASYLNEISGNQNRYSPAQPGAAAAAFRAQPAQAPTPNVYMSPITDDEIDKILQPSQSAWDGAAADSYSYFDDASAASEESSMYADKSSAMGYGDSQWSEGKDYSQSSLFSFSSFASQQPSENADAESHTLKQPIYIPSQRVGSESRAEAAAPPESSAEKDASYYAEKRSDAQPAQQTAYNWIVGKPQQSEQEAASKASRPQAPKPKPFEPIARPTAPDSQAKPGMQPNALSDFLKKQAQSNTAAKSRGLSLAELAKARERKQQAPEPNQEAAEGPREKQQQTSRKNRPDFSQLQNDKVPITAFEFDSLSALIDEI